MKIGCWYRIDGMVLRLVEKSTHKKYRFVSIEGYRVFCNPHKSKVEFLLNPEDEETAEAVKKRTLELISEKSE